MVSPAPPENRLHVLDFLRFLAACAVLFYHLLASDGGAWGAKTSDLFGPMPTEVFSFGWLGAECFFVISGFVICMSSWGKSLSEFFISRTTRLLPLYLFAVLVTTAVLTLWPLRSAPQPSHALYNLTMLHGFLGIPHIDSVYWTLYIELKFYLLWAVVVAFGVTYRRVVAACALWLVLSLYAIGSSSSIMQLVFEPRFSFYFICGIALYLIYRSGSNLLLWGLFAVSAIMALFQLQRRIGGWSGNDKFVTGALILAVFLLIMGAVAMRWLSWVRWRGFVVMGALTYPLYLLHQNIGRVLISRLRSELPAWALLALVTAFLLGLAYLAHRLIERPAAELLKRRLRQSFAALRKADSGPAVPVPAPAPRSVNGPAALPVTASTARSD